MIITISGANFSASNIGTLSTWTVSKSIGAGAEHSIPSYVDKNSAFNYTITLKDGYTFGTYSVTMGGQTITPTVTETSMTINIPSVTGAIRIDVKTINSSTGEPEEPGTGGGIVGETVQLTSSNSNTSYNDTANHLNNNIVAGQPLPKSSVGTKGIIGWDIPQYAIVTLTVSGGGNYGMAITDNNDIVVEGFANSSIATDASSQGVYTFNPVLSPARLYVSTTKFVSASYVIISEEDLKQYEYNILMEYTSESGKYIGPTQTVGTDVKLSDMGGTYYMISEEIPTNTITTINVKTGGNYGMCIADINGKVLENNPSSKADADGNIVFSKQTVPYKLWVSKTKYNSAKYKFV